ncbi:MAG: putative adenylylsulfate reductase-associated electron transfer protein QmoC [Candidatus Electronema aureum]|uniref:Adenylylsulfate reductase-associated electron transfer protein QmoC n=1 Tax=Candidatus Electronema aureum TaxID=2005002 RepID=A0A521G4Q5_9BACT|nr:MAG: putative adenylylsulfate reductase-associated electron transfer protein QmoC [Candidatus Electronema aureum]
MSVKVQPDIDFIKEMKEAGGDTLKKCFQCATCSVVCPLSSDQKPFPRQQMIFAQWGLKDRLLGDPNVLLCHQCGDCTAYCPRGARPGDVMGAIRAYAYRHYGWPSFLANLASRSQNLPILFGIPAAIICIMWLIAGGSHNIPDAKDFVDFGYSHFFGHWNFKFLTRNVLFIDLIMIPTASLSVFAAFKGVTGLWKKMTENAGIGAALYRPSPLQFVKEFLWPSVQEIVRHDRFKKCEANKDRVAGHQPLMWAFIGLFFVTGYSFISQDFIGILLPSLHGPMSMLNPVKIIANIAAIAMIYGVGVLWSNRSQMEESGQATSTFYDWFLIWMIMGVGVTGMGSELMRLIGIPSLGYLIYYLHLVSVMMLFLYMPYTKFAHLVYRTLAMTFERYRESAYVKNSLKG